MAAPPRAAEGDNRDQASPGGDKSEGWVAANSTGHWSQLALVRNRRSSGLTCTSEWVGGVGSAVFWPRKYSWWGEPHHWP
jgi:hypothetical protein